MCEQEILIANFCKGTSMNRKRLEYYCGHLPNSRHSRAYAGCDAHCGCIYFCGCSSRFRSAIERLPQNLTQNTRSSASDRR